MKKLFFIFISFSISMFANQIQYLSKSSHDVLKNKNKYQKSNLNYATLAPARMDLKGSWDISFKGSFIYWQARSKDFEMVEISRNNVFEEIGMDFKYKPGFKVALGSNINKNWDLFIDYTWLHFSEDKTVTQNIVKDFWTSSTALDYFKMKWKLLYDILTFNVGRESYFGKKYILKPFLGMKGGWIKSKINALAKNGNTNYPAEYTSKSWLIGPRVGFLSKIVINNIRFFNVTGLGIAYQNFDLDGNVSNSVGTIIKAKQKIAYVSPNLDINLGLGWNRNFNNSWNLDLSLSYDFLYYFTQQTLRRLSTKEYSSDIGALMLHGLTINVRFDF